MAVTYTVPFKSIRFGVLLHSFRNSIVLIYIVIWIIPAHQWQHLLILRPIIMTGCRIDPEGEGG